MELLELLTTINTPNVKAITFNDEDVMPLSDFIINYSISYSTLDEADNDLNKLKHILLADTDENDIEVIEEDIDSIIDEYEEIANKEVYVQKFKIEDNQVALILE
ncbi:TPA: hypothetical protein PQY58_001401 [Staphylococcus aureus]|uniref:hypothetical protein n=1 Tax=Staphylococcus haemolyticus TaxID=1283 RepID=UPI002294E029|nr:hypothetical protein [Staphylococcus haemolyticus]MDO0971639.1 hypothetical protein [Staphylococcus haemolyticus]HCV2365145.1 hypothetical protein [Staphylococcus aureus]HCV6078139.1 hypothetical protein [Staphylococcus aureus]HDJ5786382.1 hypothetical protein [Staphylococcus aureus]